MAVGNASTRGAARSRVLAVGVSTSILSRGLAAIVPLLVVPIGLNYLGAVGYGAWATALSVTGFVAFADLGIGTGLMTKLGKLAGEGESDRSAAREYVSSAYLMMAVISAGGLATLWGTAPFVDWNEILGVAVTDAGSSIEPIVLATLSAFIFNMLASLIVRVQYGMGQIGRSNIWQTVGSVSTLAATWIAAVLDPGAGWFVAIAAFAPATISLVNGYVFFRLTSRGRAVAPRISGFHAHTLSKLVSLGSRFLLISVLMTVSIAIDPWIVARTSGLADVTNYSIPFRVFALIGTVSLMLTLPLWPMHASALAAGDLDWTRRITLKMTAATSSVIAVGSLLAVTLGPKALEAWLGNEVDPTPVLWVGLAVWWVVQSLTAPAFMVQNGAEVLGPQTLGYTLLLAAPPLKWWVSVQFGYEWIPFVGASLYAAFVWPSCWFGYKRALASAPKFNSDPEVDS